MTVLLIYTRIMNTEGVHLSIDELAEQVGVSIRTIRYYISEGLLPGPESRGKSAQYGMEHLVRLRLIRQLVDERLPLRDIRVLLASLDVAGQEKLLRRYQDDSTSSEAVVAPAPSSAQSVIESVLRRSRLKGMVDSTGMLPARRAFPLKGKADSLQDTSPPQSHDFDAFMVPPLPQGTTAAPDHTVEQGMHDATSNEPTLWQRWEIVPGVELQVLGAVSPHIQHILIEWMQRLRAQIEASGS